MVAPRKLVIYGFDLMQCYIRRKDKTVDDIKLVIIQIFCIVWMI